MPIDSSHASAQWGPREHRSVLPAAADRLGEQIIWLRVNELLGARLQNAEVLRSEQEEEAEQLAILQDVIQEYRTQAALAGTRGLLDPAGLEERLRQRMRARGYLGPLMDDPRYEEIIVIGPRVRVIEGGRSRLIEELVPDDAETLRIVHHIIGPLGYTLDPSSPLLEAGLPDGSRLTAVIPPASNQVTVNIRRFVVKHQRLSALVQLDPPMLPAPAAAFLERAVWGRVNMAIGGPTGSGKTTLANALIAAVRSDQERVVTIEGDGNKELTAHRLVPSGVALYTRPGNAEGHGEITNQQLLRVALRLRPTRICPGEIRGAEAFDLLLCLATGHEGSLTTLHALDPRGALGQLSDFALFAESRPTFDAVSRLIARTIELIIICQVDPDTQARRISHIFETTGIGEDGYIDGHDLWAIDPVTDQLGYTGIVPRCLKKFERHGIAYDLPPVSPGLAQGEGVA